MPHEYCRDINFSDCEIIPDIFHGAPSGPACAAAPASAAAWGRRGEGGGGRRRRAPTAGAHTLPPAPPALGLPFVSLPPSRTTAPGHFPGVPAVSRVSRWDGPGCGERREKRGGGRARPPLPQVQVVHQLRHHRHHLPGSPSPRPGGTHDEGGEASPEGSSLSGLFSPLLHPPRSLRGGFASRPLTCPPRPPPRGHRRPEARPGRGRGRRPPAGPPDLGPHTHTPVLVASGWRGGPRPPAHFPPLRSAMATVTRRAPNLAGAWRGLGSGPAASSEGPGFGGGALGRPSCHDRGSGRGGEGGGVPAFF